MEGRDMLAKELGLSTADLARLEITDADLEQVTGGVGADAAALSETTIIRNQDGSSTTIIRDAAAVE